MHYRRQEQGPDARHGLRGLREPFSVLCLPPGPRELLGERSDQNSTRLWEGGLRVKKRKRPPSHTPKDSTGPSLLDCGKLFRPEQLFTVLGAPGKSFRICWERSRPHEPASPSLPPCTRSPRARALDTPAAPKRPAKCLWVTHASVSEYTDNYDDLDKGRQERPLSPYVILHREQERSFSSLHWRLRKRPPSFPRSHRQGTAKQITAVPAEEIP